MTKDDSDVTVAVKDNVDYLRQPGAKIRFGNRVVVLVEHRS